MTVEPVISSVEKTRKTRDAFLIALLLAVAHFVAVPYYLYLIWTSQTSGSTQFYLLAALTIALGVLFGIGAVLSRRGQPTAGIILVLGVLAVLYPPIATLVSGLGLVLGLALIIVGPMMAFQILPRRSSWVMTIATIVSALATLLLDVFGSAARPSLPGIVIQLLAVLVVGVLGYFIARQFRNYPLSAKLIVGLLAVAVLSTGAVSLAVNRVVQNELTAQVGASLNSLANSQALTIGNDLAKQIELIKTLALNKQIETTVADANSIYKNDAAVIQAEIARLDQQWRAADAANNNNDPLVQKILSNDTVSDLATFQEAFPDHVEIFITDRYGAVLAATNRTSDYNQADEAWWQAAYNDGNGAIYFGSPEYDESSQVYASDIAVPITVRSTGRVVGILRTTYRISGLAQSLANVRFAETGDASLVFPSGEILESSGNRAVLDENTLAQIKAITEGYSQFVYLGKSRLVSQAPVASLAPEKDIIRALGWTLVTNQDAEEGLRPVNIVARTTLLIGLITLLVVSVLAAIGGQFLSGPIVRLTRVAEQVRAGDLDSRARVESQDEIGTLAETFNATTEQLQATLQGLEQRVEERTTELEHRSLELADRTVQLELSNVRTQKRAAQLQAISDVSRTIAAVRNVTDILPRITKVVSEQFGFYHVGIFLLDEANQYAILAATNSEGGQRMLARGHRLKVGAQGIVGYVTDTGKPRIALDTGADAVFFNNPDLPNTHSEMAVPLKSGGKIIGALDVQSEQANAFTQEDADVIQTLADQVSIAIENARLFDATQKSLSESETIYRQYVRREWKRLTTNEKLLGFRYTVAGSAPLEHRIQADEMKQAAATGETHIETSEQNDQATLSVPIKLRDEVIGVLNIRTPGKRAWSQDEISLVQSVAERVAVSAENARLFDETTNRAERERTVSEITSKIRSTNDPNEMIQIAINELKQALQVKEARIVPYNPQKNNGES